MSYSVESKPDKRSDYDNPAQAKARYGRYSRDGITVHWWNSPDKVKDSDHDNIVKYIYDKSTSVHYVVSNRKITKMVEPDNVAWHATKGNPTTIGIEFSPHLNAEGYKRGGWLISELEKRYKKTFKLYKHSDWSSTSCPGTISLPRLRQEADKFKEIKGGTEVFENDNQIQAMYYLIRGKNGTPQEVAGWRGKKIIEFATNQYARKEVENREKHTDQVEQRVKDLEKALEAERKKKGGTVDPELVAKAAKYDQIKQALK